GVAQIGTLVSGDEGVSRVVGTKPLARRDQEHEQMQITGPGRRVVGIDEPGSEAVCDTVPDRQGIVSVGGPASRSPVERLYVRLTALSLQSGDAERDPDSQGPESVRSTVSRSEHLHLHRCGGPMIALTPQTCRR